jgi:ubiquinone/menaquinone biosynthesis C-methylase UbiE
MLNVTRTDETQQRDWLASHAREVLVELGIGPGQVVLDFGCGKGTYALAAARLVGAEGAVHALDKDGGALAELRQNAADEGLENVGIAHTSGGLGLPLPNASCDAMLVYDVLQLIDDWPELLAEAHRVLKPGALLSVFPMHVDNDKVRQHAQHAGLAAPTELHALLNFTKPVR